MVVLGTVKIFSADALSGLRGITYDVPWTMFGGCCQWVLDAVRQTVSGRQPLGFKSLALRSRSAKSNALDNHLGRAILEMTDSVR